MSYGRPARWLAPLALVAALVAVFAIVTGSGSEDSGEQASPTTTEQRRGERANRTTTDGTGTTTTGSETSTTDEPPAETYVVRAGDTLASISEETDTTVEELQELNPGVDSNSLTIGQEIKLAR